MRKSIESLAGESQGVSYEFPLYRFAGTDKAAPSGGSDRQA